MHPIITLNEITIRTQLIPGDIDYVIYLHGKFYSEEYGYGIGFESYVAKGLNEFFQHYDPETNRVWICEHENKIIGFLLLMNRGEAAQLRYFIIIPAYRNIGLGNKLMNLYMEFFHQCGYCSSYLWTTHELNTAAHLYMKQGFRLTEEKQSTVFGKLLTEQRYDYFSR